MYKRQVQCCSETIQQTLKEKTLEDSLQNLNISTPCITIEETPIPYITIDETPNILPKQTLENDLASRAQSLLAEDRRLKLQIADALKAVEKSKVSIGV